ncbi:MAG: hypothetical protein ABIN37_00735 [Burkholderiaceae bacterium]
MNVMDILKSYVDRPTDTQQDFDEISRQVPAEALGGGIADAFRSDRTPDFGSMVSSLFGGSNPQQRAGLLGQLMRAIGPSVLASIAGGAFAKLRQGSAATAGASMDISPTAAASVSESQVREIAAAAEKEDPSILDRVGAYYSQHPEVVKVLGGAALAIALGHIGNRMKR